MMRLPIRTVADMSPIFIQKTNGQWLLAFIQLRVIALQFDTVAGHFNGQAACLLGGMVFVKMAHIATQAGNNNAARIEAAVKQKNRAEDVYKEKKACFLRRASSTRVKAPSSIFWSNTTAIVATELRLRSMVKSVLCAVTDTLTPKLFPCPPSACALASAGYRSRPLAAWARKTSNTVRGINLTS